MKLQLLQPRTGVRSSPLSSALALCRPTPANIAISSAAVKLRFNSLKQTIPFLYHKRADKNNTHGKRCTYSVFMIAPAAMEHTGAQQLVIVDKSPYHSLTFANEESADTNRARQSRRAVECTIRICNMKEDVERGLGFTKAQTISKQWCHCFAGTRKRRRNPSVGETSP